VSRQLDGEVTPETAAEAARHFGASHFVLGSAVQVDDGLHLEASLYGAGAEPLRRVALQENAQGLLGMIDGLAIDLMKGLVRNAGRFDRLESATTRSPEALRAFLEGNAAMRAWRHDDAAASFERAVELDPEFAFAWYRLSFSVLGSFQATRPRSSAFEAAQRAVALADRVPRREGELLRGYADMLDGRLAEAEARYRRLIHEAPEDWDAWHNLSEVLFHYNAYRGRSILEALEPSERAMALDPDHPSPRAHIFVAAPTLGDAERARRQAEWLAQNAADFGPTAQLWLAETSGDPEANAGALERLASAGATHALGALVTFPVLRKQILALIQGSYPEVLEVGRHLDSFLDARTGHLAAWRGAGIDRARYFGKPVESLGNFPSAYLDAFPDIPASSADLEEQRRILRSMQVARQSPPIDQARRVYLVGLLSARLSDTSAVEAPLAELERLARPPVGSEPAGELATSLRGYVAWQHGNPTETLRLLETLPKRPLAKDFVSNGVYVRLLDRFLTGLALEATGALEQAAGYHEFHVLEASLAENVLDAFRAHRRAQLYEKLGRSDEAIADYETFISLWADCDPELRPRVEEARARVAALRASRLPAMLRIRPETPTPDGDRSQLRQ
jgi:tetratricopeptide (TPR) repeat protein